MSLLATAAVFMEYPRLVAEYQQGGYPEASGQVILLVSVFAVLALLGGLTSSLNLFQVFLASRTIVLAVLYAPISTMQPLLAASPLLTATEAALCFGWTGFTSLVALHLFLPRLVASTGNLTVALHDTVQSVTTTTLALLILAGVLKHFRDSHLKSMTKVDIMNDSLKNLIRSNMRLQDYARSEKAQGIAEDRKVIVREIHDSAGYSLTTLKMMLEAALRVLLTRPQQARSLIGKGVDEIQSVLDTIRSTLRRIRSSAENHPEKGTRVLLEIAETFREVTETEVHVHLGNARQSYGVSIDSTLRRVAQECLANAFRHGRATQVVIQLRDDSETLRLSVLDNGFGTGALEAGIGFWGMEQRLQELGGTLTVTSGTNNFSVEASIPLEPSR